MASKDMHVVRVKAPVQDENKMEQRNRCHSFNCKM